MNLADMQRIMKEVDGWGLEGMNAITKEFVFKDFKESMVFVNKVAEIAETHNHHPSVMIDYNAVRLTLTTHDAHSLTDKDFNVAKEIDKIHI